MKKSLWGYNVSEVDEAISRLSAQNEALMHHNDYMEDEIRILRKKLDEANANLASGMTKADADAYQELKYAYAALQERLIRTEAAQIAPNPQTADAKPETEVRPTSDEKRAAEQKTAEQNIRETEGTLSVPVSCRGAARGDAGSGDTSR